MTDIPARIALWRARSLARKAERLIDRAEGMYLAGTKAESRAREARERSEALTLWATERLTRRLERVR